MCYTHDLEMLNTLELLSISLAPWAKQSLLKTVNTHLNEEFLDLKRIMHMWQQLLEIQPYRTVE
jgi:hypothetical protein